MYLRSIITKNASEKTKAVKRAIEKSIRLTINDIFRGGITLPVSVSGRIDCGSVQVGDVLLDMPTGEKAAVKAIEVDEEPKDWAVAGHNVVLHLAGIEIDHLKYVPCPFKLVSLSNSQPRQGDILCDLNHPVPAVSLINLKVLSFESITPMMVDIHRGRLDAPGRITRLIATYDKATGALIKKKPRHIPAGSLASIQVEVVGGTIPVETSNRIVLRAFGQTVAAGLVEDQPVV